jgi:hypothetical protein
VRMSYLNHLCSILFKYHIKLHVYIIVIFQICDVVVVSRLLNATLVIPEIQSTTSSKGIRLPNLQIIITILIKFDHGLN